MGTAKRLGMTLWEELAGKRFQIVGKELRPCARNLATIVVKSNLFNL